MKTRLRAEVVAAGFALVAILLLAGLLPWPWFTLTPLFVAWAVLAALLLRVPAARFSEDGVSFVHRGVLDKTVPYDVIADTRIVPAFAQSAAVALLDDGGRVLGKLPMKDEGHDVLDRLLRAMGPRLAIGSLAALARPKGASVRAWRDRLDARARAMAQPGYRSSPAVDIAALAAAVESHENALDVRAAALYVLVQSGLEDARAAAKKVLSSAPPLALALARTAEGGALVVSEEQATAASLTLEASDWDEDDGADASSRSARSRPLLP